MFEIIKCYIHLRKANKFLRGMKRLGEITQDEEIIKEANSALYLNEKVKRTIWHNKKMAEEYNLELIRQGLCKKEKGYVI